MSIVEKNRLSSSIALLRYDVNKVDLKFVRIIKNQTSLDRNWDEKKTKNKMFVHNQLSTMTNMTSSAAVKLQFQ